MKTFKDFLADYQADKKRKDPMDPAHPWRVAELQSPVISANDLIQVIGRQKFDAIVRHDFYKSHLQDYEKPTAFRYNRDQMGTETIEAGTGRKTSLSNGDVIQHKVLFVLYKNSVRLARVLSNKNGEKYDSVDQLVWDQIKYKVGKKQAQYGSSVEYDE